MIPPPHRHRFQPGPIQSRLSWPFPAYLVRDSDHVPDIEMMMERHRVLRMGQSIAWLEHLTIQRTMPGFLLYVKLSDASQMSHHPEYHAWVREALPLDEALGSGWRTISESEVREMLGDVAEG
jgi:hypothetical protein